MPSVCSCGKPARAPGQRYCHECHAAAMRRYRERHHEQELQREREDPRRKARKMVRRAVRRGHVERPETCTRCGDRPTPDQPLEKHHDDYSKPLAVDFLCHACHMDAHGKVSRKEC